MYRIFLLFCLLFFAPVAHAQDSIKFVIGSIHLYPPPDGGRFNERNFGIILQWEDRWGGLDYSVGGFINSHFDFAPYAGVSYSKEISTDFEVNATLGIAYYGENANDTVSLNGWNIAPWIETRYQNAWVTFIPVPTNDGLSGLFAYGFEFDDESLGLD